MRAVGVTDGDMRADHGRNPLRAGHEREHQLDTAQVRPDFYGLDGVWIWKPDIDFDFVIELIGQWNEFDFLRKVVQHIHRKNSWVSYS